jgi:hypothetical protein
MSRWVLVTVAVLSTRLGAQVPGAGTTVPDGYRPPPGMCRIWIEGVPPDRQPAPTDCATAVRRRPANARVIFGDLSKNDDANTASNASNGGAANGASNGGANAQAAHEQADPSRTNEGVHPAPPAAPAHTPPTGPKGAQDNAPPVGPPQRTPNHVIPSAPAVHPAARTAPTPAPPPPPKSGGRPPSHHGSF